MKLSIKYEWFHHTFHSGFMWFHAFCWKSTTTEIFMPPLETLCFIFEAWESSKMSKHGSARHEGTHICMQSPDEAHNESIHVCFHKLRSHCCDRPFGVCMYVYMYTVCMLSVCVCVCLHAYIHISIDALRMCVRDHMYAWKHERRKQILVVLVRQKEQKPRPLLSRYKTRPHIDRTYIGRTYYRNHETSLSLPANINKSWSVLLYEVLRTLTSHHP